MVFDAVANYKSGWLSMKPFKVGGAKKKANESILKHEMNPNEMKTMFSAFKSLPTLKEATRELVSEALIRTEGNRTVAADILGITRQALSWRLKKHNTVVK